MEAFPLDRMKDLHNWVFHADHLRERLGHTIQSRILESTFYQLETQPVVIGAIDTPVPFSPPLENYTIPSVEHVINVIQKLMQ